MDRAWTMRCSGMLITVALTAVACGGDDSAPDDSTEDRTGEGEDQAQSEPTAVFPGESWASADPGDLGFDPGRLDDLAAEAEANDSDCLVVTRHGQVVGEWYWNDTDASTGHEAFSATKSYTSALVGIAQEEGHLDIDDKASDHIEEWVGTPSEDITIRNILSNDSGLHSPGAANVVGVIGTEDATSVAIALEQDEPPGTVWSNNEAAIQTLDAILEAATGQEPADYAREKLLAPIRANDTEMGRDGSGNTWMFWQLQTTCLDAARLGHLFLQNGNWDGTQVLPEAYVTEAAEPSQELNPGYGFLWWLNRADTTGETDTGFETERIAGAPDDMYWALGAFGQVIQVHPGTGTVVTRFGGGEAIYDPTGVELTARIVTEALDS